MRILSPACSFQELVSKQTGDLPRKVGESFNTHYVAGHQFIKVTRPWVKPHRLLTEARVAAALHGEGFPVTKPLGGPLPFYNEAGGVQYASFWELVTPLPPITPEEASFLGAQWINKLWESSPPLVVEAFQLEDFQPGMRIRMKNSDSHLAPLIVEAVGEVVDEWNELPTVPWGFIHGDPHGGNLLPTTEGIKLIDWESACIGPREWDAAQNIRFTPEHLREAQWAYWLGLGLSEAHLKCFYRARTLSNLSHLVVTHQKPPIYYEALSHLQWND